MLKKIIDTIASIRLAIILLILLTIVSVFGVIVPQGLEYEMYVHNWGSSVARVVCGIGIDHVFTTVWFYFLMFLFSCNILACSQTRLWRNARHSLKDSFLNSRNDLSRFRQSAAGATNLSCAEANVAARISLRRQGYRVVEKGDNVNGWQLVARKGMLKDIGSLVFHLSIIVLFIGGLVGIRFGYSMVKEIEEGKVVSVPDRDFLLRCDWFSIETNNDGMVKDYKSKLSLLNPDSSLILEKVIEVNDPLSYEGIRFYQASYGQVSEDIKTISLGVNGPGIDEPGFVGTIPYDSMVNLPGSTIRIQASNFLPDFIIDMQTRIASTRSNSPENPAVKVVMIQDADTLYNHWVFFNFPEQHSDKGLFTVIAQNYTSPYFTGIQIRKNPGAPFIWIGIICMTLGIFAIFYISRKGLYVFLEGMSLKGTMVWVAGNPNRTPTDFSREFVCIGKALSTTLQQDTRNNS